MSYREVRKEKERETGESLKWSPWGREESGTTERVHFHFSLSRIGEGNGNPVQYSCLENPRDGGAWWAAIYGVAQSRTRLKRLSSSSSSIFRAAPDLREGGPRELLADTRGGEKFLSPRLLVGLQAIPWSNLPSSDLKPGISFMRLGASDKRPPCSSVGRTSGTGSWEGPPAWGGA